MSDDENEVDVASILARLNANARDDDDDDAEGSPANKEEDQDEEDDNKKEKTQESQDQAEKSPKKETKGLEVFSVRTHAEEDEDKGKRDFLAEHADNVNLSHAIMSEPEKYLSLLGFQPLNAVFESVRTIFATNSGQIMERQKAIVDNILKTRDHSNLVLSHYSQRNTHFARHKPEELEKKIKEIKTIELEGQKVKHYLLNLIKRLEDLEEKVDTLITAKNHQSGFVKKPKRIFDDVPVKVLDEETKE